MPRTVHVISATLLTFTAWAEDAPAPAPAPAAETPPAATPAQPAPATPADAAPAAAAPPGDQTKGGDVVFDAPPPKRRAASAPKQNTFGFGVVLGAGYDSNILLENTDTPTATDAKGAAYNGEVRAQARLVDEPGGRLSLFGGAEINDYPSESEAQLIRYGGGLSASTSLGGVDPGLVVGYNRFLVDHELAAVAVNVNAYLACVGSSSVGVLGVGSQYVEYIDNDPITGTLYDVNGRYWWLLESGRINRRIELGLKVGKNVTQDDDLAYVVVTPSVGLVYRVGDNRQTFGTQDLGLKLSYELRNYPEPASGAEAEKQKTLQVSASYDFWLQSWISLGVYGAYSKRDSNDDIADYTRKQVGCRLTATW